MKSATKDPCITIKQSMGIHYVVNDQGFAMYYRTISNTLSHLEVFGCERINTKKRKDRLTPFLGLNVLEAKIFQYDFPDNITVIDYQHLQNDYTRIFGRQG